MLYLMPFIVALSNYPLMCLFMVVSVALLQFVHIWHMMPSFLKLLPVIQFCICLNTSSKTTECEHSFENTKDIQNYYEAHILF